MSRREKKRLDDSDPLMKGKKKRRRGKVLRRGKRVREFNLEVSKKIVRFVTREVLLERGKTSSSN